MYWIGMKKAIQEFVKSCDVCEHHKYSANLTIWFVAALPIPNQVWEDISLEFITGLPKANGMEAVLVVVDRLSEYAHF